MKYTLPVVKEVDIQSLKEGTLIQEGFIVPKMPLYFHRVDQEAVMGSYLEGMENDPIKLYQSEQGMPSTTKSGPFLFTIQSYLRGEFSIPSSRDTITTKIRVALYSLTTA